MARYHLAAGVWVRTEVSVDVPPVRRNFGHRAATLRERTPVILEIHSPGKSSCDADDCDRSVGSLRSPNLHGNRFVAEADRLSSGEVQLEALTGAGIAAEAAVTPGTIS